MSQFTIRMKGIFGQEGCQGDARTIARFVPEGWFPVFRVFLEDVNIAEMTVHSANQSFTFRREPGAVAPPWEEIIAAKDADARVAEENSAK